MLNTRVVVTEDSYNKKGPDEIIVTTGSKYNEVTVEIDGKTASVDGDQLISAIKRCINNGEFM